MSAPDVIARILATVGVAFLLISAVGIFRLPDAFTRMHAAAKASTMGVGCMLLASGFAFGGSQLLRAVVGLALFFITAPIATATLARATHRTKARSDETFVLRFDDLERDQRPR